MRTPLLLLMFAFFATQLQAQKTYLHCGQLIDVAKEKTYSERTVVIEGAKIVEVLNGYVSGTDLDRVIDLKNQVVMPGFIDMHVHIEHESNPKTYMNRFTNNPADDAFESTIYAKRTLLAGFTSVRDLGGSGVNIALRKAIAKGYVVGPRIFTAGKSIATTGGHADPTNGVRADLMVDPGPKEGVVNSPEDARKAVRQRYKDGSDVIKITATGGVLSMAKNGQNPQFNMDELKAIVETAKDYNMLTAAHAHGDAGARRAVLAGIKTIEHGTLISEETMKLMKEHNTYLVPTISAGNAAYENAKIPGYFPEIIVPKALEIGPKSQSNFAKAYKLGVPIVFGTDAGVSPHGANAKEFRFMHEAGMPVMEALYVATVVPAMLLDRADDLGQIKKGYFADIVAVDVHPNDDVSSLEDVSFVMKEGVIYKQNHKEQIID